MCIRDSLNYSGAQGSERCVEVYSLEEGDWSGPAPALSLPVSGSGSVRLSFDLMAERVSASVSDGEGERPASADMGEPPARPDTAEQIVYITDTKHVAHGETVPVVAQYFGGGSAPQLESFGQPEALEDCEAVYILTVRFE